MTKEMASVTNDSVMAILTKELTQTDKCMAREGMFG